MIKFLDPNLPNKSNKINDTFENIKINNKIYPLPSEIEISESGMCNRKCSFCPRSDPKYDHVNEFIKVSLLEKLLSELKEIEYKGTIRFSGFVEPLLDKRIFDILHLIRTELEYVNIEIVTNGDVLNEKRLAKLFKNGLNKILISAYDSKEQAKKFENLCLNLNLKKNQYIVRHRYLPPEKDFGITLSNRAGQMENAEFKIESLTSPLAQPCFIPGYTFFMDYQGDVLICPHDWGKKLIIGNLNQEKFLNIWLNKKWINIRKQLIKGNRKFSPCNLCDVNGTLMGKFHSQMWENNID